MPEAIAMRLADTLITVWRQALVDGRARVELPGGGYTVTKTRARQLRTVDFDFGDWRITGIEQNPETSSRWAQLARQGQRVMQFSCGGRYIGNVCEGKLTRYAAWQALELPG